MSLLDDLKAAAKVLDPQFQISSNEVQSVVSAAVHYLDKGDEFLKAAEHGADDVLRLLQPPPPPEASPATTSPAAAPSEPAPVSDQELEAQIADMQAQLAARQATAGQTTVTHEPGASPEDPLV